MTDPIQPVANARMYSATPQVRADWKTLLAWTLRHAGLEWELIDYDAPAPLNTLWARDDLGLVMMCGLPFSQKLPQPKIIAAPVPSPTRYGGKAVYFSDIVVGTESPYRKIEDTFGGVVGYTLHDSMSGGVAWRDFLAPYKAARGERSGRLYKRAVGDLIHARGIIDAIVSGDIVVGALDSYYHDLLKRNDTEYALQVKTIATTASRPIPPLIATADVSDEVVSKLRASLKAAILAPELVEVRDRLLLADFAVPTASDYDELALIAAKPTPAFEDL